LLQSQSFWLQSRHSPRIPKAPKAGRQAVPPLALSVGRLSGDRPERSSAAWGEPSSAASSGTNTPRFKTYVNEQRVPSYTYAEEVRVGAVLPERGVTYREVPAEYGVKGYRYTVVNNRTVLVEPGTRRVVQVIE